MQEHRFELSTQLGFDANLGCDGGMGTTGDWWSDSCHAYELPLGLESHPFVLGHHERVMGQSVSSDIGTRMNDNVGTGRAQNDTGRVVN